MGDDDLYQAAGRIEGKLDMLVDAFRAHLMQDDRLHADLNTDVALMRGDIDRTKGALSMLHYVGAMISAVVAFAVTKMHKWLQ